MQQIAGLPPSQEAGTARQGRFRSRQADSWIAARRLQRLQEAGTAGQGRFLAAGLIKSFTCSRLDGERVRALAARGAALRTLRGRGDVEPTEAAGRVGRRLVGC